MRRAAILAALLVCGCDPIWSVSVKVRDPASRPVAGATVAVACAAGEYGPRDAVARTDEAGAARVGGLGDRLPPRCDLTVARPGYRTKRVPWAELCPSQSDDCDRVISRDVTLLPEATRSPGRSGSGPRPGPR